MRAEELREFAESKGSYWFDPDTMKAFGSIIETDANDDGLFITSEKDNSGHAWNGERRYTIRKIDWETAEITDISEYGEYGRLSEAIDAMLGE